MKAELLSCKSTTLSAWEIQTISNKVTKLLYQWQSSGLAHLNPNLSPVLTQAIAPEELAIPDQYLNGTSTLWDIAWQTGKTIVEVGNELKPWIEKEILQFQSIPDISFPSVESSLSSAAAASSAFPSTIASVAPSSVTRHPFLPVPKQALIACIDDSPVLVHTLNKILLSAGYRTLNIQEPMRGFTQLIEHKPDLILLDLQLPNADGYSVCKFLRDTPVFAKTPIIILTAQNTIVDRCRAKQVGATEFLGKPPRPEELLQLVQTYLSQITRNSD